jgi:murein L,D-transpeptidase YafK
MSLFLPKRALALLSAALGAAALAGCQDTDFAHRGAAPIPPETLALMEDVGVSKDAPTLIRAYKKEAELEVWKMKPDGRYAKLKTYPMCRWSGQLGPKTREGDRQVPEGFYAIAPGQLNPNSSYYLSFNVGYPNAYDRAHGATGGTIMVHGACSSAGCFSMTDRQIAEIYAIVRTSLTSGQHAVQMQSYPFRMTAENLAKHRLDPHIAFWRQLKEGADHFEATLQEPSVGVCGRRYVFNAQSANGRALDPDEACPPLNVDRQIASLVAEKQRQDEARIAELSKDVPAVRLVYQDGGQHPSFASRMPEVSRPETILPPTEIALEDKGARAGKKSSRVAARGGAPAGDAGEKEEAAASEDGGARGWMALHGQGDARPTGSIPK